MNRAVNQRKAVSRREQLPPGYRTGDWPALDALQSGISWAGAAVAAFAILTMVVLTTVEVLMRYFFSAPLGWNVTFTEQYLMVALAFFGLTMTYRSGAHVAVVSLYERFSGPSRKVLMLFSHVVIMLGTALVALNGAVAAGYSFQFNAIPAPGGSELPLNHGYWRLLVPIGAGMLFVNIAIDFVRELISPWNAPVTDVTGSSDDDISIGGQ